MKPDESWTVPNAHEYLRQLLNQEAGRRFQNDGPEAFQAWRDEFRDWLRSLLRPGGLILWHDFCPDPEVHAKCASPRGVQQAISAHWSWLERELRDVFWIKPSWILLGIKGKRANE